ncbi:NAD(P)/FAD-dependent oxidoreductase [Halobacillus salinus]|uniref:Ferredoxin--NADP reductase n=1 Tax=Halobacillus salinus TaxID=192814 RepID=A0A4Z0GZL5_9BACI|nr:NAD(P)/FAD-dependent oxidoreductase [Halobacillus salinus]TGB02188.1 NAD(P)/FAD-dependent oxidoreductase [Halobacillus salinus]
MSDKIYDITVIGGGPVGLFTAFYGGLRQASVNIIESLPHLGGQLTALYPEKYIYDVAGFPKVRAQELVDNLEEQAMAFDPTVTLKEEVKHVERVEDDVLKLTTNKGVHYTRTMVITAGNGAFAPRKLKIDDTEKYEETNLHYHVTNMDQFKDKKVVIAGGGDSAVDWALMLEPIAKEVSIIHRRAKFRAHEHSVEQLMNSSVNVYTPYAPEELIGEERIEQVKIQEVKGEKVETIDVDDVIINYGFISSLGPIKDWELEIDKNSIVVNSKMETNIKGIYAAGDICTYPGKVKLIASGFGEGPTAVNNAKAYIDPSARVQPKHSTSMFDQ